MMAIPPDRMDPVLDLLNQRPRKDWQWRFDADSSGHSAVNAVALANAALLTYSDELGTRQFLKKWGLTEVCLLRGFNTQGFIARQDNVVVIAFRGTEPINAEDWLSDISCHQRILDPGVPGLVHGGFAVAINEVIKPTLDAVSEISRGQTPRLFITGHSLGGALAVLAAAMLHFVARQTIAGVYTYGQPRVGDPNFSTAYDTGLKSVTFRYVNDLDIVPHVPPVQLPGRPQLRTPSAVTDFLGTIRDAPREVMEALRAITTGEKFAHVGQLKLFLKNGSLTTDMAEWQNREVIYSDTLAHLFDNLPSLLRAKLGAVLREKDRILDHDPLNGYLPKLERQR